jgi:hypothetical protein
VFIRIRKRRNQVVDIASSAGPENVSQQPSSALIRRHPGRSIGIGTGPLKCASAPE